MTIEDLVEIEQIRQLKYRYMRALDTHDWALMRQLFTPDARTWYSGGTYASQGIDNIMHQFEALVTDGFFSSHVALHPEIELLTPTSATGHWRMEDTVHIVGAGSPSGTMQPGDELQGAGYYTDTYTKTDGIWQISSTGYRRIYERLEARGTRIVQVHVDPAFGRGGDPQT